MSAGGSRSAVVAAFVANFLVAIAKFVAAGITGSVAMLSEGFHSVADTGNQGLLLWGLRASHREADAQHPFGRGKEIYFWSFLVAVILFVGGSVLAFQHGLDAVRHPHAVESPMANFVVLGAAILIEGWSFRTAVRAFNAVKGSRSWWPTLRQTKDASLLVVLLEDASALLGLMIAAAGLTIGLLADAPIWDGIASLAIAVLLAAVAIVLAIETKALLIGEAATRSDRSAIRGNVLALHAVESVGRLLTMHLGPDEILVNLDVDLVDGLDDDDVEQAIDDVEDAIRGVLPSADNIFVELQSRRRHRPE